MKAEPHYDLFALLLRSPVPIAELHDADRARLKHISNKSSPAALSRRVSPARYFCVILLMATMSSSSFTITNERLITTRSNRPVPGVTYRLSPDQAHG